MKKVIMALVLVLTLLCGSCFVCAASDPAVTVVNPQGNSTVYADNILISVKVTATRVLKITVFEEKLLNEDGSLSSLDSLEALGQVTAGSLRHVVVSPAETFYSNGNLSFYTKELKGITPGIYKLRVTTLDENGRTQYLQECYVVVRPPSEAKALSFQSEQSGVLSFLQSFLKNIFGN